jgi:hypothetical protein
MYEYITIRMIDFSEERLIQHKNYINWNIVLLCRYLSEYTIYLLKDVLDWEMVLKYQKLSPQFIEYMENYYSNKKNAINNLINNLDQIGIVDLCKCTETYECVSCTNYKEYDNRDYNMDID